MNDTPTTAPTAEELAKAAIIEAAAKIAEGYSFYEASDFPGCSSIACEIRKLADTAISGVLTCAALPDHADILETIENAGETWEADGYRSALAEVRDMANIGRALMERLPKGYSYDDRPTEIVTDLQNEIADLKAAPGGAAGHVLAAAAQLIHDYYTREIERLMHQAQHWHDEGRHPAAVHHRVTKADAYYQIIAHFDPAKLSRGWKDPFEQMSDALARPPFEDQGTYPPSAELHAYRDPRFTAQKLAEVAAISPAKTSRFDPPGLWESEPRSSANISGQVIR